MWTVNIVFRGISHNIPFYTAKTYLIVDKISYFDFYYPHVWEGNVFILCVCLCARAHYNFRMPGHRNFIFGMLGHLDNF